MKKFTPAKLALGGLALALAIHGQNALADDAALKTDPEKTG